MRVFVALELDAGLRRALARVQAAVPLVGDGVRWVGEPLLHLTMRFVGEVQEMRLLDVTEAVEVASQRVPSFSMRVRGLGCFPNVRAPRILWAGIATSAPLQELAGQVERELRERGFPPDFRRFSPHVTLARIRKRGVRPREEFGEEKPVFGEQWVEQLTVMESRLARGRGPTYLPLTAAPLGDQ